MSELTQNAGGAADAPVLDRSRVTHKQYKRTAIIQIEMKVAERDMDADKVAALLEELDTTNMQMVVSLPAGWLPDGMTLATPNWIDYLSQTHYEALASASQTLNSGEKKA